MARNIRTMLRDPSHALWFTRYHLSRLLHHGNPLMHIGRGVQLGHFINYTEYRYSKFYVGDDELALLESLDLPEGIILDIGANLGAFSLLMSALHPQHDIHAFEPNPSTVKALTGNIRLNRATRIAVHEKAVAAVRGRLNFMADPLHRETCRISETETGHEIDVEALTLDSFLEQSANPPVAMLKIDVEGFESDVLSGATGLLAKKPPKYILYEVSRDNCRAANRDPRAGTDILLRHGYSIHTIGSGGKLTRLQKPDPSSVPLDNWLACHGV